MNDNPREIGQGSDAHWCRIHADLVAHRNQRLKDWGDLDDLTLARYLAGSATEAEAERVRRSIEAHNKVRECAAIVRELDIDSTVPEMRPLTTTPTTIPLWKSALRSLLTRRALLVEAAVAAAILLACGLIWVLPAHRGARPIAVITKSSEPDDGHAPAPFANVASEPVQPVDAVVKPEPVANPAHAKTEVATERPSNNATVPMERPAEEVLASAGVSSAIERMPESTVTEAQTGPEKLLASRGLHKVKTWYVVATEDEIDKEFNKIRPTYNAMEIAMKRVITAKEQDVIVNTLDADEIATQTNINALQIQLGTLPNNLDGRAMANEIRNQIQQLNFHLNEVRGSLQIQRTLRVPPAQQRVFWGDFVRARETFLVATKEIRPVLDKAGAEYRMLENDAEVKEALRVISDRTKVRYSLGPSKFLKAHKTALINGEKMVSFYPDAYQTKQKTKTVKQKKR
jgi:hypothetical protein